MANYPRIVCVEDDDLSRLVISILLRESLKLENVVVFEDSENFDSRIAALPFDPDIFLLDIHVQPIDGFEMLNRLKAHPTLKLKPAIAITASVMSDEIDQMKRAGFDGMLAKPVNEATFGEAINQILRGEKIWVVG